MKTLLITVGLLLCHCGSAYVPCDTRGVYRCNDNVVELCNGKKWQPRTDCDNIMFDGEIHIDAQCTESGSIAECEVE